MWETLVGKCSQHTPVCQKLGELCGRWSWRAESQLLFLVWPQCGSGQREPGMAKDGSGRTSQVSNAIAEGLACNVRPARLAIAVGL